ncbi:N13 [Linum perenne]
MGVTSATHEFKSSIPAGRMYKAIIEESPTIFPKFMPNYKSEVVQGDGGVGTILQTCFHDEGTHKYMYISYLASNLTSFKVSLILLLLNVLFREPSEDGEAQSGGQGSGQLPQQVHIDRRWSAE